MLPGPPTRRLLVALGVAALVTAVFAPGLGGELLNWDDNRFVRDNPLVHGVSAAHLRAIVSGPHQEAYHPLHLLSYTLDHALYGLWAPGYKIHNLLLYLLALLLLFRLLRRLELSEAAALVGVLVFAVHPLHVEAVVWVSARKEPLSLCFMLGAALLHVGAAGWRDWRRWAALGLFGAALLTKTSTVVLPLLLVALDVLLRRRRLGGALLAAAPMLALALGVGLYVVGLWQQNEMIRPRPAGPGGAAALVLHSLGHHLAKLAVPLRLSPVYPIDRQGHLGLAAGLGLLSLAGLGLVLWRLRSPQARLAAAWWLIALLPVANLVPVYFFVQDRYAFVASVALAIALAAAVDHVRARGPRPPVLRAATVAVIVAVATLAVLGAAQSRHWRSSLELWRHAVAVQPRSYYAHLALGHTLRERREPAAAATSYRRAVELQPRLPAARIALCLADAERRAPGSTAKQVEQDLRGAWLSAEGLTRLAGRLSLRGLLACAALAEHRAFELDPPTPASRVAAASRWTLAGQAAPSLRHLGAIERDALPSPLRPAYLEVRAQALVLAGRTTEADQDFRRSLDLAPRDAASLERAAAQLQQHGRSELARFYRRWAAQVGK